MFSWVDLLTINLKEKLSRINNLGTNLTDILHCKQSYAIPCFFSTHIFPLLSLFPKAFNKIFSFPSFLSKWYFIPWLHSSILTNQGGAFWVATKNTALWLVDEMRLQSKYWQQSTNSHAWFNMACWACIKPKPSDFYCLFLKRCIMIIDVPFFFL